MLFLITYYIVKRIKTMAKDRQKLLHIHSSVADKQPTAQSLEVGEIAVNNASGKEFISLKNTENKVVRLSSDLQLINWMEKKEVLPYKGYVRGSVGPNSTSGDSPTMDANGSYGITESDLLNNTSNIIVKINQVVASNTTKHDNVNGAKDRYNQLINPSTDGGLNDGAGFYIDMSRYAMIGANPTFSSITINHNATIEGNTYISGDTIIGGDTNISGDTHIAGDTIIEGDTNVSGDTHIGGNTYISGDTHISGDTYISGDTHISGDTIIEGDTNISGDTHIGGNTYVSGDTHISGDTYISGDTHISGDTIIEGGLTVTSGFNKTISWKYGDVRNEASGKTNLSEDASFVIPKSIDDLTNWNGECVTIPHNLCIDGTITASGAIYSSDMNLKENIKVVNSNDFNRVKMVQAKSFNFKDDESKRTVYGVIAQDVEKAGLEELVHIKEDGYKAVDYTAYLILKCAYLEDFCAKLNGKIAELSEKVKQLEK